MTFTTSKMDREDYRILPSGMIECWRDEYYFMDEYGNYQIKNRFFTNKMPNGTLAYRFIDDGTGHFVLNKAFISRRGRGKK